MKRHIEFMHLRLQMPVEN